MIEKKISRKNTIGVRAKIIRTRLGLTQKEMVKVLQENGIETSQSVISSIEKDVRKPTLEIMELLATKWNVDLNWLIIGYGGYPNAKDINAKSVEEMFKALPQDKQETCSKLITLLYEEKVHTHKNKYKHV